MTVRAALSPLVRGTTYRRGLFLVLGGVLALPYVLLAVAFVRMWTDQEVDRALTIILSAVAAAIAVTPAFLPATRTVEIVAVRGLLDMDIPTPTPGTISRETRLRSALWFAMHLAIGGLVALALLVAVPIALVFIAQQLGIGTEELFDVGPLGPSDTGWWTLIGVSMLVALVYAVSGLGTLAAAVAPTLLGPSTDERIAALEAEASELAERNRLARELHDSVGHALTVTTLQAAAARQVLDTDPDFVRNALVAVEEAGRAAMDDLDHVLGLLRDRETRQTAPQRTLTDLDRLIGDAENAGVRVDVHIDGDLETLPTPVSREGYRIVQESLTNVARHARDARAELRLTVGDALSLEVRNPIAAAAKVRTNGGRGLDGMRERVTFLGGQMSSGPEGDTWLVTVQLPVGRRSRP